MVVVLWKDWAVAVRDYCGSSQAHRESLVPRPRQRHGSAVGIARVSRLCYPIWGVACLPASGAERVLPPMAATTASLRAETKPPRHRTAHRPQARRPASRVRRARCRCKSGEPVDVRSRKGERHPLARVHLSTSYFITHGEKCSQNPFLIVRIKRAAAVPAAFAARSLFSLPSPVLLPPRRRPAPIC